MGRHGKGGKVGRLEGQDDGLLSLGVWHGQSGREEGELEGNRVSVVAAGWKEV